MFHWMSWWIINFYACFWVWHSGKARCVPWQSILWLLLFALLPLCCLVCCFSWRNRLGCVSLVLFGVIWFACIYRSSVSLYKCSFDRLCSYKDRATVRYRQTQEKKKGKLSMQERCCLLKAVSVLAKRSLQQSHFRSRKHIGFMDPTSGPSQQYQAFQLLPIPLLWSHLSASNLDGHHPKSFEQLSLESSSEVDNSLSEKGSATTFQLCGLPVRRYSQRRRASRRCASKQWTSEMAIFFCE